MYAEVEHKFIKASSCVIIVYFASTNEAGTQPVTAVWYRVCILNLGQQHAPVCLINPLMEENNLKDLSVLQTLAIKKLDRMQSPSIHKLYTFALCSH